MQYSLSACCKVANTRLACSAYLRMTTGSLHVVKLSASLWPAVSGFDIRDVCIVRYH